MSNMLVIFVIATLLSSLQAKVTDEQCKQLPQKELCLLEYPADPIWKREPTVKRYIFNWLLQMCLPWHWWMNETLCPLPQDDNNFRTSRECVKACSHWP